MKIHKFGEKQNTKGQIYRCKKLNQDICYTFLIIHDLKCPRICGHAVYVRKLGEKRLGILEPGGQKDDWCVYT